MILKSKTFAVQKSYVLRSTSMYIVAYGSYYNYYTKNTINTYTELHVITTLVFRLKA